MIGAGRDRKEDAIDPAVGIILEVKVGEKVDAGSVLCRIYYTREDRVEEAAEMVEDAFRISSKPPDERNLILEVVVGVLNGHAIHAGCWASLVILGSRVAVLVSTNRKAITAPRHRSGAWALQFAFAFLVLKTDFGKLFQIASAAA